MRRAFFFIVAVCLATSSLASIPRASMLDRASEDASAFAQRLSETRVWASEVLAPFERPAESELTRALRQAYADSSTTNASGLGRFLSVDPAAHSIDLQRPQTWNRYTYAMNDPVNLVDPDGNAPVYLTPVTEEIGRYMYHFDWLHNGLHIDISVRRSNNWYKLGRVGAGLKPIKHMGKTPKIPNAALKALLNNRASLSAKAQAALIELLAEEGFVAAAKLAGKLAIPIAIATEIVFADELNASEDKVAIAEANAIALRMFNGPMEALDAAK
jgi:hypothetical protein